MTATEGPAVRRPRLLVLIGPTGTGKTETALEVARRLDGESVGCDALQVCRGLDAGTAKAGAEQRREVPHHLIDVADPRTAYTLADYVHDAETAIDSIAHRGKIPLVVGGTGLYLRGLMRGIVPAPRADPDLRRRLRSMADRFGAERLHRWLGRVDPPSAERLAPADTQRITRALEIALSGETTWSERLRDEGTWSRGTERFESLKIGLDLDTATLDARLGERVERFYEAGLVNEIRELLASGVPREANAFKAIGYREVLKAHEEGRNPFDARDEIARNTRRYSRRQRSWFRNEPGIVWLDAADGLERLAERILEMWAA
jgi:tRNA dimethylallyltransferase